MRAAPWWGYTTVSPTEKVIWWDSFRSPKITTVECALDHGLKAPVVLAEPPVAEYAFRPHTREMAHQNEPDDLQGITIPDDPRDLDADRWQYYEELARADKLRHSPDGPSEPDHPAHWRDGTPWFGFKGSRKQPLIFLVVAVCAMAASLLLAFVPRTDAPQQTRALAAPMADVGQVGGLLPTSAVGINGAPRLLRDIRPAVIALVPEGQCSECETALAAIAEQSDASGVRTILAADRDISNRYSAMATQLGLPLLTYNPGTFGDFRPTGLTLLLVAPDGTVADVVRLADSTTSITGSLSDWSTASGQ